MLVTYETAAAHLKHGDLTTDPEVQTATLLYLAQAEAFVLTHITRADATWTDATDPASDPAFAIVQAAILGVLGNLWRFRGDDADSGKGNGPLIARAVEMLAALRDPSFA